MREISVCIPSYNRFEMTVQVFEKIYDVDEVTEIIISDDCSTDDSYDKLVEYAKKFHKIRVFRNQENQDCYRNKKTSIELATNEWCCLWDSDNIFSYDYLFRLFQNPHWDKNTIYTPDFAEPTFNFTQFSGLLITKENVSKWIDAPLFETMLNANNFFVNRNEFLKVWDGSTDPVTSDSIFTTYNWLKAGNKIQVVGGLKYFHRIHDSGHYNSNVHRTPIGFHDSILQKLRELK